MPTIPEIANQIATTHRVDHHAAIDVVRVYVDQITDDPDLYDPDTEELTEAGAELVTGAVAESYKIGAIATTASLLLEQIADAEQERAGLERQTQEARARRDELIRRAMQTELRRPDIAAAAGVKEARLHQIRHGRR